MSLGNIIRTSVESGILTLVSGTRPRDERYECKCGKVVKRYSVRSHLSSKYHVTKLEELPRVQSQPSLPVGGNATDIDVVIVGEEGVEECGVCYEEMWGETYACRTCRNKHCMTCHNHPSMSRCPFCRTEFDVETEADLFLRSYRKLMEDVSVQLQRMEYARVLDVEAASTIYGLYHFLSHNKSMYREVVNLNTRVKTIYDLKRLNELGFGAASHFLREFMR